MRNRAPLALMEQVVMLAVFALAAALCLEAFVKSEEISREWEARDRAVLACENAAEAVRWSGGNLEKAAEKLGVADRPEETTLSVCYDGDWTPADGKNCVYRLTVERVDSALAGLGKARVSAVEEAGQKELFALEIAWQEEDNG